MKIYILTKKTDFIPELEYICKLFSTILDAEFTIGDISLHSENDSISIAYCSSFDDNSLPESCRIRIIPDQTFWEHYLSKTAPPLKVMNFGDIPIFLSSEIQHRIEETPFNLKTNLDLFSSAFFLVSRYEETYSGKSLDSHGRYRFENSILDEKLIDEPLVNIYAKTLADWIERAYGKKVPCREDTMSAVISHDVDVPFYYCTIRAEISELFNSLISEGKYRNIHDLLAYASYLLGLGNDDFNTFDYLIKAEKQRYIKSTYFILFNEENSWGLARKRYAKILRNLSGLGHEIALHPGYDSFLDASEINAEKRRVETLSGQSILGSRNHFLRFNIRASYRSLERAGFVYDSTLGYPEREGFRAGICTPFKIFDIQHRQVVNILEIPLVLMDGTLRDYRGYQPDEALERVKQLIDTVSQVRGTMVFNWHNTFLVDDKTGWRDVFEQSLNYLLEKKARFYTCCHLAKKYLSYWP